MSDNVRLCRALAKACLHMGAGQSRDYGDLFNELGWVFKTAADKLETDEITRLGIIGTQPSELVDSLHLEGQ